MVKTQLVLNSHLEFYDWPTILVFQPERATDRDTSRTPSTQEIGIDDQSPGIPSEDFAAPNFGHLLSPRSGTPSAIPSAARPSSSSHPLSSAPVPPVPARRFFTPPNLRSRLSMLGCHICSVRLAIQAFDIHPVCIRRPAIHLQCWNFIDRTRVLRMSV